MAIAGFFGVHDLGSVHLGFNENFNRIHLALGLLGMLVGFAGPVTVVIIATVGLAGYIAMVAPPFGTTFEPSTQVSATLPGATSTPTSTPAPMPTALPGPALPLGPPVNSVRLKLISGKLVQTRSDCAGVNPAQEFLDPLRKGKSDPKKELYIREGTVNSLSKPILREVSPDAEGNFEIVLPPGRYCVVGESKKDALSIPDLTEANKKLAQSRVPGEPFRIVSQQCFRDWWRTCDKILRVGNQNIRGFRVELHQDCFPPCVKGGPKRE